MKKIIPIVLTMTLASSFFSSVKAQFNLVPNPSFEIFDTCPSAVGQIRYAPPWINVLYGTTPDYFNSCDTAGIHLAGMPANYAGNEIAHSGVACAGIATYNNAPNGLYHNYREYIEVQLNDSLIAGVDYCIRFYVSACDNIMYFSNNIGVYFSTVAIYDTCSPIPCNLTYMPQFENPSNNNLDNKNGWTLVSGSYIASGGEKYITIGNFRDSTSTIATIAGGGTFQEAAYYLDDVLITPCDSLTGFATIKFTSKEIKLFPVPIYDILNIESNIEPISEVEILDVLGKNIFLQKATHSELQEQINLSDITKGIYLIKITTQKNQFIYKIIKN